MLRRKGGCAVTASGDGITVCPDGKQKGDVPTTPWFIGIAFAFVEMYVDPSLRVCEKMSEGVMADVCVV